MQTLAKVYEDRAENYTRAAERTDDPVFRRLLLMLALQWKQAAQEAAKSYFWPKRIIALEKWSNWSFPPPALGECRLSSARL
jgi:hypothetical protein